MKKQTIVEIICALFIALFVYAALTKLLEYDEFRIQLSQSPLLTAHARWAAWAVPTGELLIAVILGFKQLRLIGLFAALSLMAMFTSYIAVILNFSDYIPCSCGGVLEKLGWTAHIIFNLCFLLLAVTGVVLFPQQVSKITPLPSNLEIPNASN